MTITADLPLDLIQERLRQCERAYVDNFCTSSLEWGMMVFQDKQLPDMYGHNFIRIPHDAPAARLRQMANIMRTTAANSGRPFLQLCLSQPLEYKNAVASHYGYYVLPGDQWRQWPERQDCRVVRMDGERHRQQMLELYREFGDEWDVDDFCRRREERYSQVYLDESKPLDCWLCYLGDELAARAELLVNEGTAKIETLITRRKWRRQGLATTLLKRLAAEAQRQGADLLYLIADEDDSPRLMYENLGFVKMMDDYELRWMFTK